MESKRAESGIVWELKFYYVTGIKFFVLDNQIAAIGIGRKIEAYSVEDAELHALKYMSKPVALFEEQA
jgi:hypothetical protein